MFPYELVELTDGENAVRITVRSAESAELWEAEITVQSMFVTGSALLMLYPSKLQEWAKALDRLAAGEDATWMESGNGPTVRIRLDGGYDCPEAEVEDESSSMVTVRVPIALEGDWVADHRTRLARFVEEAGTLGAGDGLVGRPGRDGPRGFSVTSGRRPS
ncbi:hypothetical protein ACTI_66960 [Actinoplanes sp. OR16]|uniref:DUF5959 family protein n=1 Tax=Actinoplanes sp. OR16 TaxID=946334 RepID=UPI000F6E33FC|nr:DUF5959 family protein [Actinoplanes sp. OR16]BBH70011.1 hypothetical protein ACTI_66960 [Actinoplanes sp. OR16]